ncbi:MAG TPA: DUF1684 domain-containing protein [Bacteroidales bacterium]
MKTKLLLSAMIICGFFIQTAQSQNSYEDSIQAIRNAKNIEFKTPGKTPLNAAQIQQFTGLSYFPINEKAKIKAVYTPFEEPKEVSLATTAGTKMKLLKYGTVTFTFENKSYTLDVFQNKNLPEFGNDNSILFIPFTDPTNKTETFNNGRYLRLSVPASGTSVYLDFNTAENPYNAYNKALVSIVAPPGNAMMSAVNTGERKFEDRAR